MIRLPKTPKTTSGEEWRSCVFCGASYKRVELRFDSGSVEPTADETFTGATSGATGVVVGTTLISGTYAAGTAVGIVELSSPTGITSKTDDDDVVVGINDVCFSDDEAINGSTAGDDIMTAKGDGTVKKYGNFYPASLLVERDGKYYCLAHYNWYFSSYDKDDEDVDLNEEGRGTVF